MIEIYFFAALVVINSVYLIFNIKKGFERAGMFSALSMILATLALIVSTLSTPSQVDIYRKVKEYEELKRQVEIVKNFKDPGIKNIFAPELREKIQKMNDEILENRFRYDSKWSGHRYSKEIGELEELEMP
jgi:hypothetical protein